MRPTSAPASLMAVIAVALTASCAATPPRSATPAGADPAVMAAQREADEALANEIYRALNADPKYYYRHVDVRVNDGVASLSGYVWTTDAIYEARRVAGNVTGVTRVVTAGLELERNGRDSGGPTR